MFIEVYVIPNNMYQHDAELSKLPENRQTIDMHGSIVQYSHKCPNRAEIHLRNDGVIHVVGTYDEIIKRMTVGVGDDKITRVDSFVYEEKE